MRPGDRLGPYEVLAKLGAGGMGEVYKARDARLERTLAIKLLPPEPGADPDCRARVERGAAEPAVRRGEAARSRAALWTCRRGGPRI